MICANCNQVIYKDTLGDWVDITDGDGCLQDTPETDVHMPDFPEGLGMTYELSLKISNTKLMSESDLSNLGAWRKSIVKEMINYLTSTPLNDIRFGLTAEKE